MGKRRNGFSELLHGCGPGAEAPASGKVLRLDVVPTPDELRRSRAAARRLLAADTVDHDSSRSACRPSRAGSQAGVADLQSPVSWRGHLDAVSPHATSRRACLAAHVRGIFLAGDEFSSRAVLHFSAVSAHSDVLPAATEKPRGEWGSSRGCASLKLYGGPFLLYFAAERRWKAVSGMIAAICCAGVVAIAVFGWPGIHYYLAHILVRSVTDGSIDLYNPGVPTISTMLRRLFVREPALNPNPLWNAPGLFFWLRTFVSLAIVVFAGLGLAFRSTTERRDFAWFTIAVLLD